MASFRTKLIASATAALASLSLVSLPAVADGGSDDDPLAGILDAITGGGLDDLDTGSSGEEPADPDQPTGTEPTDPDSPADPDAPTDPAEHETEPKGDHRPGTDAFSVHVPDDVTMNVDGKQVRHPCAGRDLLYHGHVDAAYVTKSNGKLAVMSVNGSQVKDPGTVCMRLAPEADSTGREVSRMVLPNDMFASIGSPGRIVWRAPQENIDNQWRPIWAGVGAFDPAHEWKVPKGEYQGNKVQLNLADFKGPGDFELFVNTRTSLYHIISSRNARTATFDVGVHAHVNWTFTQPGIYELTWQARAVRLDGTVEQSKPVKQYWLVGSDQQVGLPDGTTTGMNPISITAEQQRESMGLHEPKTPYPAPPEPLTHAPTLGDKLPDISYYRNAASRIVSNGEVYFDYRYTRGEEFLSGSVNKDGKQVTNLSSPVIVEVPDSEISCVPSNDDIFGPWVASTGNKWVWATPVVGNDHAPSVSVDTRNFNFEDTDGQRLSLDLPTLNGPASAGTVIGDPVGDKIRPLEVANSGNSRRIQVMKPGISRFRFVFTEPGLYEGSWVPIIKTPNGNVNALHHFVFAVGNETINAIRQQNGITEKLPVQQVTECKSTLGTIPPGNYPWPDTPEGGQPGGPGEPSEGGEPTQPSEPTQPGGSSEPSQPTDPTDPTQPGDAGDTGEGGQPAEPTEPAEPSDPAQPGTPTDPAQPTDPGQAPTPSEPSHPGAGGSGEVQPAAPSDPEKPSVQPDSAEVAALKSALQQAWGNAIPNHIVERGHMDLAAALRGSTLVTFLKDGEDPANIVERPSGSFAIAVPDGARIRANQVPDDVKQRYPELANGIWELPEVQNPRFPWLGFNTEQVDYSQLKQGTGGIVTLQNFQGPGRMVLGHVNVVNVEPTLDSADPSSAITYPSRSHDHEFFWFSTPGVYSADFVYHWTDATDQQISVPLHVSFLVGDKAIEIGRESVASQTLPVIVEGAAGDSEPDATEPAEEPQQEPTVAPTEPGSTEPPATPSTGDTSGGGAAGTEPAQPGTGNVPDSGKTPAGDTSASSKEPAEDASASGKGTGTGKTPGTGKSPVAGKTPATGKTPGATGDVKPGNSGSYAPGKPSAASTGHQNPPVRTGSGQSQAGGSAQSGGSGASGSGAASVAPQRTGNVAHTPGSASPSTYTPSATSTRIGQATPQVASAASATPAPVPASGAPAGGGLAGAVQASPIGSSPLLSGATSGVLPNSGVFPKGDGKAAKKPAQKAAPKPAKQGGHVRRLQPEAQTQASEQAQVNAAAVPVASSNLGRLLPGFLLGAGTVAALAGVALLIATARKKKDVDALLQNQSNS